MLFAGCGAALPNLDLHLENATDPVLDLFEDESVAIRFTTTREHLEFDLENKTNGAIRIFWDDAVFEDAHGNRHSLCHSGTDFGHLDDPQDPTVVPARRRVQGYVIPRDHITPSQENPGEWDIAPLLVPVGKDPEETRKLASQVVGKEVRLVIPLSVGGRRQPYRFRFKITPVVGPGGRGETLKTKDQEFTPVVK
jgi:hypothetical protein